MITLYDQAHRFGGLVASTDNFSELGAGLWTLHGDVGDLAWSVPAEGLGGPIAGEGLRGAGADLAARPTDGLGMGGDEGQIGVTYLQCDVMVFALVDVLALRPHVWAGELPDALGLGGDREDEPALGAVLRPMRGTWHERVNPIRLDHPTAERYEVLDTLDARLFRPPVLRAEEALFKFSGELRASGAELASRLERARIRLVTAESCTAGLIAACVAAAPGANRALEGASSPTAPR
jgi:nicotinamide-nucleotide amidase